MLSFWTTKCQFNFNPTTLDIVKYDKQNSNYMPTVQ